MGIAPYALGAIGVLVGWCVLREFIGTRTTLLSVGSLLGFAAVLLPSAATAVGVLTGSRRVTTDAFFNRVVVLSGPADLMLRVASPLLLCLAVISIIGALHKRHQLNGAALLYALLLTSLLVFHPRAGSIGGTVTNIALALAVAFVKPGLGIVRGIAYGVSVIAALSGITALIQPAATLMNCSECVSGFVFSGITDNKNALALLLAMGIPFVWFGLTNKGGRTISVLLTAMAVATGSDTGAIASLLSLLVLTFCAREQEYDKIRFPTIASATAAILAAAVVVVPFLPLPDDALTGRAGLWRIARERIAQNPWNGYGADSWRRLVDDGVIFLAGGYSTHNQFLETLHAGGVVAAAWIFAALVVAVVRAGKRTAALALFAAPTLICAITERPWSLGQVDWLAWVLPGLLVAVTRESSLEHQRPSATAQPKPPHRSKLLGGAGAGREPVEVHPPRMTQH